MPLNGKRDCLRKGQIIALKWQMQLHLCIQKGVFLISKGCGHLRNAVKIFQGALSLTFIALSFLYGW